MTNPDNSGEIADALIEVANELELLRDAFPRPRPDVTPLVEGEPGYPFAPGTQTQGFLGQRWNRRDGNVYGTPAPLGGTDAQSQNHPSRAGRRQRTGA